MTEWTLNERASGCESLPANKVRQRLIHLTAVRANANLHQYSTTPQRNLRQLNRLVSIYSFVI